TDNQNLSPEQQNYVRICAQKAEQIKGLSDELFLYFWAYNRSETETEIECELFDAGLLMEQIIGDYIPVMEAAGGQIQTDLSELLPSDTVRVHIDCMRRVTDNVFDNLIKYADLRFPVTIRAVRENDTLTIHVSNTIAKRNQHTSSTKIGVKTCTNMMNLMKGRFAARVEGKSFTASLTLPLQSEEKY
ncbi:MAG: HAMP domain-containing histidine kinase, partial [Clostridia bacterium]|nr:HAMP domain-containing histidine kinase [Clostridia bacterium]